MLNQAGCRGEEHVRRDGRDDDYVNVRRRYASFGQSFLGRFHREIAGRHALVNQVAFPNSGAFHDPVMVRLDHLLEILISQKARRDIRSQSADFGANRVIQ